MRYIIDANTEDEVNYCIIYKHDMVNGPGVRVSLFVSGCSHHCEGCFNQKAWAEDFGSPYTQETEDYIIEKLKTYFIRGLSILGGEPMMPNHQEQVLKLIKRVRAELPTKDIWMWSGYTLEEIQSGPAKTEYSDNIMRNIDVLVDGRYVKALRDQDLPFRGSSNQRILDMRKTTETGQPTLLELSK